MKKEDIEIMWEQLMAKYNDLENPCDNCEEFECELSPLKPFLKRRYRKCNIIDHKACLAEAFKLRSKIKKTLFSKEFNKISHKVCACCNKKVHTLNGDYVYKLSKTKEEAFSVIKSKFVCQDCKNNKTDKYKRLIKEYNSSYYGGI